MHIDYTNAKVERYFKDFELMKRKIGKDITRAVKKQFDYLQASDTFAIYLSLRLGKPHPLTGDKSGKYAVSVAANFRLILKIPLDDLSLLSLKDCKSVIIEGVEEYHAGKNEWLIP